MVTMTLNYVFKNIDNNSGSIANTIVRAYAIA